MIAFSACIGFGLFLQTGNVINVAGPGLAVVAFVLASTVMWCVVSCLGEMTALFPVQGPLFEFPGRYIDEAVGYATGWLAWFSWAVAISNECLAVSELFKFRFKEEYLRQVGYPEKQLGWSTEGYSPAVWIFSMLVLVLLVNMLPVRLYGQLEYIFGCLKITFIVGLILYALRHILLVWTDKGTGSIQYYPQEIECIVGTHSGHGMSPMDVRTLFCDASL